ncbi:MAG: ribosomal-processing cysteine protease Prp [Oscillospiraceae bacterium]|nr:ribosomal-processing cysteine protease Prp [Oscillospiraceae bacterium]
MIEAKFSFPLSSSARFIIKGHSGSAELGRDIICAAVSSAAYMAANTVTEVLGVKAEARVRDGYMKFEFSGSEDAAKIIRGLKLHLEGLSDEYPNFIKITTEV